MTDRLTGCRVVFDQDIREDDAEHILNAIRMIRGVAGVDTSENITSVADITAQIREDNKWRDRIVQMMRYSRH